MAKKELWLQNKTSSDVSLGDLGVKVAANKTINVYAYNPYIEEFKVEKSMESGSIRKRLDDEILRVVKSFKNPVPHTMNHLKTSSKNIEVVKTKSSVLISTKDEDVLEDGDLGDFADYGLGDLDNSVVTNVEDKKGSAVVVQQKQDETPKVDSITDKIGERRESFMTKPLDPKKDSSEQPVEKVGDMVVAKGDLVKHESEDSEVAANQADKVIKDDAEFDVKVATKDELGAIVMKLKEVKKATKAKKTAKKAKKTKKTRKKSKKKSS